MFRVPGAVRFRSIPVAPPWRNSAGPILASCMLGLGAVADPAVAGLDDASHRMERPHHPAPRHQPPAPPATSGEELLIQSADGSTLATFLSGGDDAPGVLTYSSVGSFKWGKSGEPWFGVADDRRGGDSGWEGVLTGAVNSFAARGGTVEETLLIDPGTGTVRDILITAFADFPNGRTAEAVFLITDPSLFATLPPAGAFTGVDQFVLPAVGAIPPGGLPPAQMVNLTQAAFPRGNPPFSIFVAVAVATPVPELAPLASTGLGLSAAILVAWRRTRRRRFD